MSGADLPTFAEYVVSDDPTTVAAERIADLLQSAVADRGVAHLALSGGSTPGPMLERLAAQAIRWTTVNVFQVDERVGPAGSPERNLGLLQQRLVDRVDGNPPRVHPMPVEQEDLEAAADDYARLLSKLAGHPPVLDVVQLGLGADGHTASLFPGDGAAAVAGRDVATTGPHRGSRRMTLTLQCLDRARAVIWLVSGSEKRAALGRLLSRDTTLPASWITSPVQTLVVDPACDPT
jgi:6-phosphogluconolactonase